MNSLVIKFVQLFSIAFSFDNVKCDSFFLGNAEDDVLNHEAGCMVICMDTNLIAVSFIIHNIICDTSLNQINPSTIAKINVSLQNLSSCHEFCELSNSSISLEQEESNGTVQLICRDYNSLTIKVKNDLPMQYNRHEISNITQKVYNGALYLVKLQEINHTSSRKIAYIVSINRVQCKSGNIFRSFEHLQADTPIIQIKDLRNDTSYNVTVTIFDYGNDEYITTYDLQNVKPFETLKNEHYKPQKINDDTISVEYDNSTNDSIKIVTTIQWNPAEGISCVY